MQAIITSFAVSSAAEALHPGPGAALRAPGAGAGAALMVVAQGEPTPSSTFVRVAVQGKSALTLSAEAGCLGVLGFGAGDMPFAAALVAVLARGSLPAASDPGSMQLLAMAERVAQRDIGVLINGPTGTGKEVLANHIHRMSTRRNRPLVAVNCAALPEAMLEAVLFGHERGAFTGALQSAKGLFRAADGGTLLLDEIAELPLALQAKLLRVLQEQEVLPIGASVAQKVDVRIIACANRDLPAEVAAGRFRADLYYRLAVFPLTTLPLAERRADIIAIAAALWLRDGSGLWPTPAALRRLAAHDWPGNVRELGNVLQRATVLASGVRIEAADIVFDRAAASPMLPTVSASLGGLRREREFAAIRSALADCAGRRSMVAHRLGISERTLRYKLAAMAHEAPVDRMTMQ